MKADSKAYFPYQEIPLTQSMHLMFFFLREVLSGANLLKMKIIASFFRQKISTIVIKCFKSFGISQICGALQEG